MENRDELRIIYRFIVQQARSNSFVSYGQLAQQLGRDWNQVRFNLNNYLGNLLKICKERNWPAFSAIIVNNNDINTGKMEKSALAGFESGALDAGYEFDHVEEFLEEQRQFMFEWVKTAPNELDCDQAVEFQKDEQSIIRKAKFMQLLLEVLRDLNGYATPGEVYEEFKNKNIVPEFVLNERFKSGQSKFKNHVQWARYYGVQSGLIDDSQRGTWELTKLGLSAHLSRERALELIRKVNQDSKTNDFDEPSESPTEVDQTLFEDAERQYWFVGATYDGSDDQTERFVSEGIWENQQIDKFSDYVKEMKSGDYIAIKATYTRKYGLPFENHDKFVSCMRIKAIGVITESTTDGNTVKVNWTIGKPKEWYFYTYRVAVVQADPSDEYARRLILFTFGKQIQDYEFFLRHPYWAKRYENEETIEDDINLNKELANYEIDNICDDGCFLSKVKLSSIFDKLRNKRNLILQGPPGTGKTWLAMRMGCALLGTNDRGVTRERMRSIQFHPSLSYEDFVRGWRPDSNGQLSLTDGIFLECVEAARAEPDWPFVLLIEEINRGNPAQILGEMLTLIEKDKRNLAHSMRLVYPRDDRERVYVPDNLFIIGTMNIADRSLALVDFAFRRRFAFQLLEPALNNRWRKWCSDEANMDRTMVRRIRKAILTLNEQIANDRSLGLPFQIGHSYITPAKGDVIKDSREWFINIVESEIVPLLDEYWFDNPQRVEEAKKGLLAGF